MRIKLINALKIYDTFLQDQEFSVCECWEMSAFALMSAPAASAIAISNNGDVTSVTDIRLTFC